MSGLPRAIEVENHDNDVNVLKLNLSNYSNFLENSVFQNLPIMIHTYESYKISYIKEIKWLSIA